LRLAVENGCKTVAFPAISCGAYGYPPAEAARIALQQAASFLQDHQQIEQVVFVLFDERAYQAFDRAYCERFGPKPEITS
jgi:O-acetyl-ADP-ribose deacetylase (regulator of RNase III)